MSQTKWLLVEWVTNKDIFPTYGVVKSDHLIGEGNPLQIGNFVMVARRNGKSPKQAQVLKISDSKQSMIDQKDFLQRQDNQVKSVLAMCVRTLTEAKAEAMYGPTNAMNRSISATSQQNRSGHNHSVSNDEILKNELVQHVSRPISNIPTYHQAQSQIKHENAINQEQVRPIQQSSTSQVVSRPKTVMYREKQTQTCEELFPREYTAEEEAVEVANLRTTVEELQDRYHYLMLKLKIVKEAKKKQEENVRAGLEEHGNDEILEQNITTHNDVMETTGHDEGGNAEGLQVRRVSAHTTNEVELQDDMEMIPIGEGYAKVPVRLLREIDWTSYTHATRVLLQAIFPRKILATHSLTGKQSPAFLDKPPKKRLDPKLVNDIVKLVSERCGVTPRLVRNIITIKCTDECKLYRNRQEFKKKRLVGLANGENHPPPSPTQDNSCDGVTE